MATTTSRTLRACAAASVCALITMPVAVAAEEAAGAKTGPSFTIVAGAGDTDELSDKILDDAKKAIDDALSEAKGKPKAPAKEKDAAPAQALPQLEGNTAPIPVPANAEGLEFHGNDGRLEFNTPSSVKDVAEFYRSNLKPQGWKEQRSVINKENMAVLNFEKDDKDISLTIMKMGDAVNVLANGSALEREEAAGEKTGEESAGAGNGDDDTHAKSPTADQLEAEETGGLPVPKEHSSSGNESTPFRSSANASVPAGVEAVAGFYRRELGKRGWKEEADKAKIDAKSGTLVFSSPEGPAKLVLGRKSGETTVVLTLRNTAAATKSGLLPKSGQSRILFGNILDKDAAIVINKQTVKIAAHLGEKSPDGPSIELKPGKYAYTLKGPGKSPPPEEFDIGADEIWGMMVGPGGVLTLQMY